MKKVFTLLVSLGMLGGCATTSPQCDIPQVEPADGATLVIYRPQNSFGMLSSTPFSIDSCSIGALKNNSFKVYTVPEGVHKIAAERYAFMVGGDGEVSGEFQKGKTYYIHYEMKPGGYVAHSSGGSFSISTHLFVADKDFAIQVKPDLPKP